MCGIAGIVAWDEKHRITREQLAKMSAAIAHRGPDGEGIFLTRENEPIDQDHPQVGLVFRRLAILDPDPRAMQPFTIGHQTLVFNGEIYNFRELKSEISNLRPDYAWRTTGDTEVVLMSYQLWGEKCVEKFNGMFALAVWDEREKSLYLARDRMGQKPLYAVATSSSEAFAPSELRMDQHGDFRAVAFASELPAINIHDWVDRTVGPFALLSYLRYGCNRWSIYGSVSSIDPGGWTTILFDDVQERTYFDPNIAPESVDDGLSVESTHALVQMAVKRQLVSDVPLGVFLSGGVDSSCVALCARKEGPVETFSISFDDPRYDESAYAREVAKHLDTNHREFRVTPNVVEDLPKLAAVFGEPFADSSALPTHYLSRETRKHVKVALSGDGGDELFGGYDRYRAMLWAWRLSSKGIAPLAGTIARPLAGGHPKSALARIARFAGTLGLSDAQRYDSFVRIFDDKTIQQLMRTSLERTPPIEMLFSRELSRRDPVGASLATDRATYLPNDLLTKVDRASMLHGLEVRCPFMDHELVQFAAGLTTDQLLKGGPKRMLREAFAHELPDFVFKRKKMGFAVPIGEWFRDSLRDFLRDHLFASDSFARQHFQMKVVERLVDEHESQRVDHSQRLYALLMLELWWKFQRATT